MKNLAIVRGYTDALGEEVYKAPPDGVDGMFLWVSLMVRTLGKTHVKKVDRRLKELPKDTDGIYNRVLCWKYVSACIVAVCRVSKVRNQLR